MTETKPGDILHRALLDLVRLCSRDHVGDLDMDLEKVVADGKDVGDWHLTLKKKNPDGSFGAAVNAYTAPAADRKKIIARVRQIASELHGEGCYAEGDDLTQAATLLENNPAPAAGDWARKAVNEILNALDVPIMPTAAKETARCELLESIIARHYPAPDAEDAGTTNLIVEEYFANGYEGQDEAEDELRRILAKYLPAPGAGEEALEEAVRDLIAAVEQNLHWQLSDYHRQLLDELRRALQGQQGGVKP